MRWKSESALAHCPTVWLWESVERLLWKTNSFSYSFPLWFISGYWILFPCYTAGPCCLSILCIIASPTPSLSTTSLSHIYFIDTVLFQDKFICVIFWIPCIINTNHRCQFHGIYLSLSDLKKSSDRREIVSMQACNSGTWIRWAFRKGILEEMIPELRNSCRWDTQS